MIDNSKTHGKPQSSNGIKISKGVNGGINKYEFILENLGYANCAAKMEDGIKKIDGVQSASVSFMAQKLIIEADDDRFDEIMKEVVKVIKNVDPDCDLEV